MWHQVFNELRLLSSFFEFHVHHSKILKEFNFNVNYLFVNRHEVHSISTHTLHNAGRQKQTKQNVLQGIGAGVIKSYRHFLQKR